MHISSAIVAVIFFNVFLFPAIFICTNAQEHICRPVKCSHGGPDIRFPFLIQHQQPQDCGFPGFELGCRSNTTTTTTMIQFPSTRDLIVSSISYMDRRLNLADPNSCVHEVFLNLNLSDTPFQYYHSLKKYTFLNCSGRIPSVPEIPCLRTSNFYVYTVEAFDHYHYQYSSCRVVKTVEIPLPYSPYLSDNSFGLALTWDLPVSGCSQGCKEEGRRGDGHSVNHITAVLCIISIFTVVVVVLGCIKMHHSTKQGKLEDHHLLDLEKLSGDSKSQQYKKTEFARFQQ